ncbi:MAG TPA: 1-acyl-sn-glycerol-3-phosphate acyltransferase [Solirubrobacteraceae bacterium]|jgi:1-acyl-sn-glycerol-3-phosphate acyltransferase
MRVRGVGKGPLFPDDGPVGARLQRRAKGIAIEAGAFVALTLLFPIVLGGAAVVDLALWVVRRKPWMAVRLVAFAWWFLVGELRGIAGLAGIYAITGGPLGRGSVRRRELVYDLRIHWARSHLGGIRTLFRLGLEVEGLELAGPGPVLILIRHASIIDNTLPDAIVGHAHGLGLRFVLKRELQMLPTIDIGGRWVPTNFVRRASDDPAGEIAKLRRLAHGLGEGEGILIYPEGTRQTPEKLRAAQKAIAERQPHIAPLADRLRHVLPPRLGGPVALLDEARGVDVVLMAHVGLDGFEYIRDVWAGGLVGTTVRVRFWRFAADEVPEDEDERVRWLYARWQTLDDWIGEHR